MERHPDEPEYAEEMLQYLTKRKALARNEKFNH